MRTARGSCARGHTFFTDLDDTGHPINPFHGCPVCQREDERETQSASLHARSIKSAVLEALHEFLPQLIAAIKEKE